MNKTILSFDLDNTIFDVTPLYKEAWLRGHNNDPLSLNEFKLPEHWNYHKDWDEKSANELDMLFINPVLTVMKLENNNTKQAIKGLLHHPLFDVYFVTDRNLLLYDGTVRQIRDNIDIYIPIERIVNCYVQKVKVLKHLATNSAFDNNLIHFDDKPKTFIDCNKTEFFNGGCILISNENTRYNHKLAEFLKHIGAGKLVYSSLYDALMHLDDITDCFSEIELFRNKFAIHTSEMENFENSLIE